MENNRIRDKISQYRPEPLGRQRRFSVFLPLIDIDGETHILFEKRSQTVSQPGETSFPGGAVEEGETYEEAAIRETVEELNVKESQIDIYGEIDYIATHTHIIHCFVGVLKNCTLKSLQPNEEVESLFTIPLDYFLTHQPEYHYVDLIMEHKEDFPFELISNGDKYRWTTRKQGIPFYRLEGQYLWGFTAQFTHRFIDIITDRQTTEIKGEQI